MYSQKLDIKMNSLILLKDLNFDVYDKTSAVIIIKNNKEVSATIRLILILKINFHLKKKESFDDMRAKYNCIGEISRNIVKTRGQGFKFRFKYLMWEFIMYL